MTEGLLNNLKQNQLKSVEFSLRNFGENFEFLPEILINIDASLQNALYKFYL